MIVKFTTTAEIVDAYSEILECEDRLLEVYRSLAAADYEDEYIDFGVTQACRFVGYIMQRLRDAAVVFEDYFGTDILGEVDE